MCRGFLTLDIHFSLCSRNDEIEMGLWIVRFLCTAFVLALGIKAPGMSRKSRMPSRKEKGANDEETGRLQEESQPQGSTWNNVVRKLKVMVPYVWPKELLLQLCVVACLLLLVCGRVVNLFTPIYYKKIGKKKSFVMKWFEY